jgi:hypothetical protein
MQQITVQSALGNKFSATSGQAVVCDERGHVLGLFSPVRNHPRIEDLQLEPPLSIEDTERLRKHYRTGKPLEEILGRLGL